MTNRMVALTVVGYGVPLGLAAAMVLGVHIHGLLFHSEAATVAALLPIFATFVAVLTSSEVDWYFITPYQRGVLNPPICAASTGGPEDPDIQERRAYAKWWVAQRGICELISYTSVAVFVAIVGVALTEDVKSDATLQIALGSFVGAGTAAWLAAYVQGRVLAGWQFVQEQSVGLGRWADGVDMCDANVEGFVRDVSITPGIQLCPDPKKKPEFVPLKYAPMTQDRELPKTLCSEACELWSNSATAISASRKQPARQQHRRPPRRRTQRPSLARTQRDPVALRRPTLRVSGRRPRSHSRSASTCHNAPQARSTRCRMPPTLGPTTKSTTSLARAIRRMAPVRWR